MVNRREQEISMSEPPYFTECCDVLLWQSLEEGGDTPENFLRCFIALKGTIIDEFEGNTDPEISLIAMCVKDIGPKHLAHRALSRLDEARDADQATFERIIDVVAFTTQAWVEWEREAASRLQQER